jgi:hypothetical protein
MKAWPELLGPLGRALQMLGNPPNVRERRRATDPDVPAAFYFDGGYCVGITGGGWSYTLDDGSTAYVYGGFPAGSERGVRVDVQLANGRRFQLREGAWRDEAVSVDADATCCVCLKPIARGETRQITPRGAAHLRCAVP